MNEIERLATYLAVAVGAPTLIAIAISTITNRRH